MVSTTSPSSFETITCKYEVNQPNDFDGNVYVQKLKVTNPSLNDLVYLKNDFTLTNSLDIGGVLKSLKLKHTPEGLVIYKEYFHGIPLSEFLETWTFNVPGFISLSTRLTRLLQKLHNHNIIVKEFIVENVLIDPQTEELALCSLGSASQLVRERLEYGSEFNYYGSLWHIAPEQTGRIGRTVDHRSDFYALGIMFYQILCGQKPFFYTDSLELIHAHIAKTPPQPTSIVPSVPEAFNQIVLKLMSKNAEDRYQSESGILHDLDLCLNEWKKNGKIDSFDLGTEDYSRIFYMSEKLYGRTEQINTLTKGWDSVQNNSCVLHLVAGFSGIGKTRLINEGRQPVMEANGYFASGKYDQLSKEIPFSGFILAVRSLVLDILGESDLVVSEWRDAFDKKTSADFSVLCDLVPEFKKLISVPNESMEVPPSEGLRMLTEATIDFFSLFYTLDKPVAFFLDDLQWADIASLNLLSELVKSDIKNVFFLGAYRDNEVDEMHPLISFIKRLQEENPLRIETIQLTELSERDINLLIADSLQMSPQATRELTTSVLKKSSGNPFFVKQILEQLVEESVIRFDSDLRTWLWSLEAINGLQISEYTVDLLLNKMHTLTQGSRNIISLAACIGNTFDFNTLIRVSGKTENELSGLIWELLSNEYINAVGQWGKHHSDTALSGLLNEEKTNFEFRFQHDKIQQAAYSLIPEDEKPKQHYIIGNLLLQQMSDIELNEKQFDVLNHFLIGKHFIESTEDREKLAHLCLSAAKKAYRNNVIRPASTFFGFGMELIKEDQSVDIFKDLLIGLSECEYLLGSYDASESLFNKAVKNASGDLNKADILSRKMALYENTQRHALAINTAREALKILGVNLPKKVNQLHVMKELMTVKFLLRNKSTQTLLDNKPMDSPKIQLIMKTLMNLWGPVYLLQEQELLALKILMMVKYSVRYGNSIESALAYSFYGYVLTAQLGDLKGGCEFGQLGMDLNKKLNDKTLRSKVIVISEGCVAHWGRPFKSVINTLREGFHVGVESNDIIYAGYATTFMNRSNFLSGEPLEAVHNKAVGFIKFVKKVNAIISYQQLLPWSRLIAHLRDVPVDHSLFNDLVDENTHFDHITHLKDELKLELPLANHYTTRAIYHYIMREDELAYHNSLRADPVMNSVPGLGEWGEQKVIKTLSGLSLMRKGKKLSSNEKRDIRKNIKLIHKWSTHSPDNYKAKYLLIQALLLANEGKNKDAQLQFEEAINWASKSGMIHWLAIINERFAHFCSDNNLHELAANHYRRALIEYYEWGAHKKVHKLKSTMSTMSVSSDVLQDSRQDISSTSLDMKSILSAAQSLSGAVRIDQLMNQLLKILVQNAGAQNAYLIRFNKNRFIVQASSILANDNAVKMRSTPINEVSDIAESIVRRAHKTGEVVIVNDAATEASENSDLKNIKAQSLLCMPISSKGKIIALIYLDNHLSKNVFVQERLQMLNFLSGQIAISLENAELYQNLEDRVLERTHVIEKQKQELEASKKQSDDLLLNILPSEIAEELKIKGSCQSRSYDSVSIMFTDFEEFTRMSASMSPQELVDIVDYHYKEFDNIIEKYNIEKIKTIGDSYMCVGGLPLKDENHAINTVLAAMEMANFVNSEIEKRKVSGEAFAKMRIGIHSGPVIAGVVGHKKFAYDIWGDAVNTASRMESSCEPGKVNISNTTYELIKKEIACTHRGKIEVKHKGEIEMYYVDNFIPGK